MTYHLKEFRMEKHEFKFLLAAALTVTVVFGSIGMRDLYADQQGKTVKGNGKTRSRTGFDQDNLGRKGELLIKGHVEIVNGIDQDEVRAIVIVVTNKDGKEIINEWLDPFTIKGGPGGHGAGSKIPFEKRYRLSAGDYKVLVGSGRPHSVVTYPDGKKRPGYRSSDVHVMTVR